MKKILYLASIITFLAAPAIHAADIPHQVGGFLLGGNVKEYAGSLKMETSFPLRHLEYLSEVEVRPPEGFKSGYVAFGNCREPGRIVRIRLKYEREDREFFEELLEHFKKRFGKPDKYKGDAFRAYIAWKWTFTDTDKNRISLILEHGSEEDDDPTGNSVKLSQVTFMEQEKQCYEKKHPELKENAEETQKELLRKKPDFKLLVPK